ncbi:hypothetical protein ACP70R_001066 [Stipagrostis hirtigluma subsp. patula]
MATELLPVVDLRGLSQSDLDALAAASAHALAPRSCPDADPLQPLKINRAVFNESAGSRKQTFSRLRLAAASSSSPSARPTTSSALSSSARNDPESRLVAYHLRRLFAPDDTSLQPPPEAQTLDLAERSPSPPPDPDRETTNAKGVSVDLVRLAGMADPYAAELRRRTAGMASETELMGFISSLAGRWVSQRQRRKYVDASFFGDHLPSGWKLQLGLKRKERMTWVHCFSYVSPKGNQFATCKEASAYLMSLLGYPETKTVTIQYDNMGQQNLCAQDGADDAVGFQHQTCPRVDNSDVLPATYVTDERNMDTINAYECQKCNLTFSDQASYMQHHMSYHEMGAKRRRTGKFGEPVVGKDGKFECPICHKTFAEESRYFGHVGAHARSVCDLQLGFGAQKQQIFSGYGELRSTTGGSPQLSSMPRDNSSSTGSSQFGSMDRSNSFPTGSPQFGSLARPNFVPTSFQFGIMARPNSVPPAESSPFGSMPGPHSVPQAKSSQFGSMARPYSVPPADSQFGSTARPNSIPLVDSSQFGSMASPNGLPPAESSQFGSMARQKFVSRTEPTLVLGYAPQMGNGPPVQVGWDMSSSKVSRGMMTCVCISCNSQFHHFGSVDGHQPVSFDLICPACKDRVSSHRITPNNGSWQP